MCIHQRALDGKKMRACHPQNENALIFYSKPSSHPIILRTSPALCGGAAPKPFAQPPPKGEGAGLTAAIFCLSNGLVYQFLDVNQGMLSLLKPAADHSERRSDAAGALGRPLSSLVKLSYAYCHMIFFRPEQARALRFSHRTYSAALLCAVAALAGCAQQPQGKGHGKEFFSSSIYGPASERVVGEGQAVPHGGGQYLVGRPYSVAGRTYVPHEVNKNFAQTGMASYYGSAFHGRRTANGEIYDMASFTAAHPTMPLPSYARVTNMRNGHSMIVRVNDRGPFHSERIMDVSARVAEALGFKGQGTAPVKVEWVAKAGLAGSDDAKLYASLRTDGRPASFDGGVDEHPSMFASNQSTKPSAPPPSVPSMVSEQPRLAPVSPVNPMAQAPSLSPSVPSNGMSQLTVVDRAVTKTETPMATMALNLIPSPMPANPPLPPVRPYDLGLRLASRAQR
jgi:rare lipoprotein A